MELHEYKYDWCDGEFQARKDRLFSSPPFYYRRRLNGKPGKTYEERNRRYRE